MSADVEIIEDEDFEDEAGLEVFEEVFQLKKRKSKQDEPELPQNQDKDDEPSYELIDDGASDQNGADSPKGNMLKKIASGQSDFEHLS